MARSGASSPASSVPATPDAHTRVLVLHGKERFLQDQYLRALRDALNKAHGEGGVDTVRFDGAQGQRIVADVMDELRSFGLMQQHKVVFVDNADAMLRASDDAPESAAPAKGRRRSGPAPMSAREVLEAYTQSPSDSATLVLRASAWKPGNLDKAILAMGGTSGMIIDCKSPDLAQAASWARRRAGARHNTSIDPETAQLLVATLGADLGRIDMELEKLAVAAGGAGEPITRQLVETMVGLTREEEFWSIQGHLLAGDAPAALTQLRNLIEVSRHDPVPITFAVTDMARKVHIAARGISEGASPAKIAPSLKIWGPQRDQVTDAVMRIGRTVGPAAAADLLASCAATDAANKSGLGDPVRNIERLTLTFATLAAGRPGAAGARPHR